MSYDNLSAMIEKNVPNILKWAPSRPQTHFSTKTKLLISGCSFTATHYEKSALTWPGFLMDYARFDECYCYGVPGANNEYIGDSILSHLHKLTDDEVKDYLVVIMWSGLERVMQKSSTSGKYPVLDGVSYMRLGTPQSSEIKALVQQSAAKMLEIRAYLERRGIQYAFTSYVNVLYPPFIPKRDGCPEFEDYVDKGTLRELLQINWIPKTPMDFMYEYGFVNDSLIEDMFHPSVQCCEDWVVNVLLPGLTAQGLITAI